MNHVALSVTDFLFLFGFLCWLGADVRRGGQLSTSDLCRSCDEDAVIAVCFSQDSSPQRRFRSACGVILYVNEVIPLKSFLIPVFRATSWIPENSL